PYTTLFRSATTVQFGEEFRGPFVVAVPQLLEQLPGEAGARLDLKGVQRRYDSILCERWRFEVAVFGDDGLMMHKTPQPGHVNPVGSEIVHEAKRKFVVVDGGREITV